MSTEIIYIIPVLWGLIIVFFLVRGGKKMIQKSEHNPDGVNSGFRQVTGNFMLVVGMLALILTGCIVWAMFMPR